MKLYLDRLFIVTVCLASVLLCARGMGSSAAASVWADADRTGEFDFLIQPGD